MIGVHPDGETYGFKPGQALCGRGFREIRITLDDMQQIQTPDQEQWLLETLHTKLTPTGKLKVDNGK